MAIATPQMVATECCVGTSSAKAKLAVRAAFDAARRADLRRSSINANASSRPTSAVASSHRPVGEATPMTWTLERPPSEAIAGSNARARQMGRPTQDDHSGACEPATPASSPPQNPSAIDRSKDVGHVFGVRPPPGDHDVLALTDEETSWASAAR